MPCLYLTTLLVHGTIPLKIPRYTRYLCNTMENPVAYQNMKTGFEFAPISCKLDSAMVDDYLVAVGDDNLLYQNSVLVPPTAIAACIMAGLSGSISFPPGTIHVSQELEFLMPVRRDITVTCQAKVSKKQDRGKLHLMTIDIDVFKDNGKVMTGKVGFVLPEAAQEGNQ